MAAMLEEPDTALYSATVDGEPWPILTVWPDRVGVRARPAGFRYVRVGQISSVRVRPDGISFRTRTGAWHRAHGLTPTQVAEALTWLRRIGLPVNRAA